MLKIEIKTGNAAFCDPFTGAPSELDEAIECKRLLEGICRELEDGATSGSIIDINGNKVGNGVDEIVASQAENNKADAEMYLP